MIMSAKQNLEKEDEVLQLFEKQPTVDNQTEELETAEQSSSPAIMPITTITNSRTNTSLVIDYGVWGSIDYSE